ncbi:pyridoxal phosphate-dependent transferase [Lentinula aff. detonsa]|uniref:Pyridoxal phosphate-dependent transferase n=1 Tax=Lentinula aff. detonsa TaxID=2804958 RepID=A0AA38KA37_9AGAR|nr:pyridoxal phosphate-dependent transferase [Lentinula aff. detonsa]
MSEGDKSDAVSAWFLGPKGENVETLVSLLTKALHHHVQGRIAYFPEDPSVITPEVKATATFQAQIKKQMTLVQILAEKLAEHSVPFWNPRYNAHMNMDTSMPGIAGYFTAMLFNPNNVALEASPLTTAIEIAVGKQLAELVGYNIQTLENPIGWGHITADGSIANLESMWAARNLKFYPLSLRLAMINQLSFIADTFHVGTCTRESKLLKDFTTWELLNILPSDVLDIPTRLNSEYGITAQYLQDALKPYLAQTVGKERLEREFNIQPMAYFASTTMHYSWPKGAAITGIGSENVIPVKVDDSARMDPNDLRRLLQECLDQKDAQGNPAPRAVYTVVAIVGSTEHGACDPVKDILDVREEFRKKGLSFVLHADGAWGTYFATAIPEIVIQKSISLSSQWSHTSMKLGEYNKARHDVYVPTVPLKTKTLESITHMRHCDSITVDPHKSGYLQYPAGGLLYRDERMRYLVTWTSPIVYRNDLQSIGVFGVEGSKPGAAPVATFFSHVILGLDTDGYGQLLGEALFSAVKMYAHLATMSTNKSPFVLRPLNLLPAETDGTPEEVEAQKELIRKKVLPVPNRELVKDKETWKLVVEMGSDLSINAFAVNFKLGDVVNEDIVEANYLNKRIFEALSITDANTDKKPPLILTSTVLPQKNYGDCLTKLKNRLGLKGSQDLYTLVNVVMSPWPTASGLTAEVAQALQETILKEREVSVYRNTLTDDYHAFVMQGTDKLFFVHLPMFNMENHRMQLIITGTISSEMRATYIEARKTNPDIVYLLVNDTPSTLEKILAAKEFDARIEPYDSKGQQPPIAKGKITDIQVIVQKKLNSKFLTPYPDRKLPFYVYGSGAEAHIDHVYTASPNIQMTADQVVVGADLHHDWNATPVLYAQLPFAEISMQPFESNRIRETKPFFFHSGAKYDNVVFTRDLAGHDVVATTSLTLPEKKNVFVDTDMLNADPEPDAHGVSYCLAHVTGASFNEGEAKSTDLEPRGYKYIQMIVSVPSSMPPLLIANVLFLG